MNNYARDYPAIQSQFYSENVERIADDLIRIAEDVRCSAKVKLDPTFHKDNPHVQNASDVLRRVSWGVANLNLDGLVARAMDADESILIVARETAEST